jgi:hypothetical protein
MPAPDEVNAPLTVRELIEELMLLPDQELPVLFAAVSPHNPFDRIAHRVIHQNFTQEFIWWDEEIGEYRIADETTNGVILPTAWVMN